MPASSILSLVNASHTVAPRAELTVACQGVDRLKVLDAAGRAYVDCDSPGDSHAFQVGGALGTHTVLALDADGRVIDTLTFRVKTLTALQDGTGTYQRLLQNLFRTMANSCSGDGQMWLDIEGKLYKYLICWLRDHTHTMKGMKYFDGDLKTGLELYADSQREDGMIYDRVTEVAGVQGWRDYGFGPGGFIKRANTDRALNVQFQRVPVENDVEFLFLECLYFTWKATGDTEWMSRYLDNAIKAVAYSTSDPYRWSEKFGLLKRGYTIDTWDFMHEADCEVSSGNNIVDVDKTTFGVMFGDNTGMAVGLYYLAEMLEAAGRGKEAAAFASLADTLLERLETLAWMGEYYRHHVTEDPSFVRDVGSTDETAQVSLSNAYSINRRIGFDKCRAIIKTYQRLRAEMPSASPGEWYNIYPPFENGYGEHDRVWQYMNGGVSTIVAGELARGAFVNGAEEYAASILERIIGLAERHGGRLHVCFNGNPQPDPPPRTFTPLGLEPVANVTPESGPNGWGSDGNDLAQLPRGDVEFAKVPFRVGEKGLGLSTQRQGYEVELRVPVNGAYGSMYLVHTHDAPHSLVAELEVCYEDGESRTVYIMNGQQLDRWFMPGSDESKGACHHPKWPQGWPPYQIAWQGPNAKFDNVGVFVWGWDNPRPDAPIKELVFRAAAHGGGYFVPAITLSDSPVWFPPTDVSFGIPDAWGAAAVVYALFEGLAGVIDTGVAFSKAVVAPRWQTVGETTADVSIMYPASDGYVAYHWEGGTNGQLLEVTGNAEELEVRLLLPQGRQAETLVIDGEEKPVEAETVGDSRYVVVTLPATGVRRIELAYA
jgi:hypothetical protein